jgi:phage baseplate assembly protein W
MSRTNSWSFPNLIDPTRNCVSIVEDDKSIVNRSRLLMLSDPTELYNNPTFGVGLKKYMFQYNNENTKARMQDNIREELRLFEPCVVADDTTFADGLIFTGDGDTYEHPNHFKMTVGLRTVFGDDLSVELNDT